MQKIATYKNQIINWINDALNKKLNVFEYICSQIHGQTVNKKIKGDLFEVFSLMYLKGKGYNGWLLADVPNNILTLLGLTKRDMGIDVIIEYDGEFSAVQCKYKHKYDSPIGKIYDKYNGLGWKHLSTFYGLCARSGPWAKHIIMTSADTITIPGTNGIKDEIISYKVLYDVGNKFWDNIIITNLDKNIVTEKEYNKYPTIDQLRELRSLYYLRKTIN